jgi:hypothetical protein
MEGEVFLFCRLFSISWFLNLSYEKTSSRDPKGKCLHTLRGEKLRKELEARREHA